MSLDKTNVVDSVAQLPGSLGVVLIVYDRNEIPDDKSREKALSEKLTTYLQFVVSGQFGKSFSQYKAHKIRIYVICRKSPTLAMKQIKGIRDHDHPDVFLPVEVLTEIEFNDCLAREKSSETGRQKGQEA